MKTIGIPGPGGSLGMCALCGKNFLLEVLTNQPVKTFEVDGIDGALCAHVACIEKIGNEDFDVTKLPPESPLRIAYESQLAKGE